MRITANMLVQQLVQAAKTDNAQKPEVGTVIAARIAEVLNGVLTLEVGNGKLLTAKDLSGRTFTQGQTVVFEVLGQDEAGNLQIRPSASAAEAPKGGMDLGAVLKKLGMPDTAGNRELLKALVAYQIPLNPENVKTAQMIGHTAKTLVQLAENQGVQILAGKEAEPLKQLASKLIATIPAASAAVEQGPPQRPSLGAEPVKPASAEIPTIRGAAVTPSPNGEGVAMKALPITAGEGVPAALGTTAALTADPEGIQEAPGKVLLPEANLPRAEELKDMLKNLSFEKIGFLLKNQLPEDMGTLSAMDRLILGKKDLTIQLRELLSSLPEGEAAAPLKEAIQNAVKAIHVRPDTTPFELQKEIKGLNQALSSISSQADTLMGAPRIQETLAEVKSSLDFLSRLSESATYLHVPVNLGQGNKPMDLYVQRDKSGQKKVNPRDTRIFISLDTNCLDTVQCLVEVKEKQLDLGFKLASEEILGIIGDYFGPLRDALTAMGYPEVRIHGEVYRKPLNLMDVTQEPAYDAQQFDMRI